MSNPYTLSPTAVNRPDLATDTDLCVKCGLCLPHCPTYLHTQNENESPRGRLSLIQGWARGELQATPELTGHVDTCLLCRACEAVCPAYVPYGQIVDRFRAAVGNANKSGAARLKSGLVRQALSGNSLVGRAGMLMAGPGAASARRLLQLTGIPKAMGLDGLLAGLPGNADAQAWFGKHAATDTRAWVDLFLGCTAQLVDSETVAATLKVLNRIGVGVQVPEAQTCCGALHAHGGDHAAAAELAHRNQAAFAGTQPIVGFASGCEAMLRDYGAGEASPEARAFAGRVKDIGQFLAETSWPDDLKLRALSGTVCVHSPCTLKNVLKADGHAAALLRRIPDLKVVTLPAQTRCCGAAGSYALEHPEMANTLRDEVLEQVLAANPRWLVTSNPGCAMHLRAGLARRGRGDIEVLHPVVLLARC